MDPQQADRLRALWKSGGDKYRSFFYALNEVQREIGPKALPRWCLRHLKLDLQVIDKARKLIDGIDAANIKADFAAAAAAEKAQRAADGAAKRQARASAKAQTRQQQQQQHRKRERAAKMPDADLQDLKARWFDADRRCRTGIENWIEGSIAKAKILCAMRAALPADQDFGAWVDANALGLNHSDRAALIGLGCLEEAELRDILTKSESRSYQLIWKAYRPLRVVGANAAVS